VHVKYKILNFVAMFDNVRLTLASKMSKSHNLKKRTNIIQCLTLIINDNIT